jgi:hypothetical protein
LKGYTHIFYILGTGVQKFKRKFRSQMVNQWRPHARAHHISLCWAPKEF